MSANIKVTLSSAATKLEVGAGESTETSIIIKNQSQIVDQFAIKVDGLDPTWWTLSTASVSLFPGDQDEVKLIIRPPKEAESRAGSYPFQVKVVSQANTQDFTIAEGYLVLKGFVDWEADMSPTKLTGKSGVYHIKLKNEGNTDANVSFETRDPEEALIFQFNKASVTIPAGGTAQANVTVKPKKGEPKKVYTFQILCRSAESKPGSRDAKTLNGQLEYPKKKFPWWIPVIIILVLAALGVAAWFLFLQPGISLSYPEGGETLTIGDKINIQWETKGMGISAVDIAISRNGGTSWDDISRGEEDDGSYQWTIPLYPTASSGNIIRVSGVDSNDKVVVEASSEEFAINLPKPKPKVNIKQPVGGEKYIVNNDVVIKWSTTGEDIAKVVLQYSIDNGNSWNNIANNLANVGEYTWKLPSTASTQCYIKITIYDSKNNVLASTMNESAFSINKFSIIIPNFKYVVPKTISP